MSSLLAILLVVNSTRGHHYLYSYPPDPQRPFKTSQSFDCVGSLLSANQSTRYPQAKKKDFVTTHDVVFNVDVSFLADALAPKLPLCDGVFQLSMDDLTFVGHPVSLSSPKEEKEDNNNSNNNNNNNNNNIESEHEDSEMDEQQMDDNNSSKSSSNSHHSKSSTTDSTSNSSNSSDEDGLSPTSIHMTLFHVVFVLCSPDLELNAQIDTLYKNVILRYTSALRYEQLRCGYVQEEVEKVLALKEEAFNKGTSYDHMMKDILNESSMARDIRQIYTAISANKAAHIIINDFIDLSLQIPLNNKANNTKNLTSYDNASLMDIYGASGYEYDHFPVLCPYHTLLLLEDPEEVLKNMPLDASPTLVQLVQILTPTQSLQELHLLLDCSLAQIYRLAAHLIYWRKAKVIHTINTRNTYVVSPNANLDDLVALEADFKLHVPNLSLTVLLSRLSHNQPYSQIYRVKELKNQYLEALTWLIRKDLVVQFHMYLVCLVKQKPVLQQHQESTQEEEGELTSSPTNNNVDEWNRLKRLNYERAPKEICELFERLKPYMNGQHHVEEIIYREGITRRQMGLVLKYYRDKILTFYTS
ncbi:UPF0171-domain-containing protein, partial [Backusella circina FSU 941]